jgi:heme iron utilization protein
MQSNRSIHGDQAQGLLEILSHWGPMTTIVFSGGSVFEFKGEFPKGSVAEGFYNFGHSSSRGFQGHLNLNLVQSITFQNKPHRGKQSYAFVFRDKSNECIFKIFLGRDGDGVLLPKQVEGFREMQEQAMAFGPEKEEQSNER